MSKMPFLISCDLLGRLNLGGLFPKCLCSVVHMFGKARVKGRIDTRTGVMIGILGSEKICIYISMYYVSISLIYLPTYLSICLSSMVSQRGLGEEVCWMHEVVGSGTCDVNSLTSHLPPLSLLPMNFVVKFTWFTNIPSGGWLLGRMWSPVILDCRMKADALRPTPFSFASVSALRLPVQLPLSSPLFLFTDLEVLEH